MSTEEELYLKAKEMLSQEPCYINDRILRLSIGKLLKLKEAGFIDTDQIIKASLLMSVELGPFPSDLAPKRVK